MEYRNLQRKDAVKSTIPGSSPVGAVLFTEARPPAPQRFVIGSHVFDTGKDTPSTVLANMDAACQTVLSERQGLQRRLLQLEQQERALRLAIESVKAHNRL